MLIFWWKANKRNIKLTKLSTKIAKYIQFHIQKKSLPSFYIKYNRVTCYAYEI